MATFIFLFCGLPIEPPPLPDMPVAARDIYGFNNAVDRESLALASPGGQKGDIPGGQKGDIPNCPGVADGPLRVPLRCSRAKPRHVAARGRR
jgi:hypothetical protein